jgi:putative chitinase
MITFEQLKKIMPYAIDSKLHLYVDPLNNCMREFEINTRLRVCAFISQVAHESGSLKYTHEIADGSQYEGRNDLGNIYPGDGRKFKGRAPLEITGRAMYKLCGLALGLDLISKPELLEMPENGCKASAWFWKYKGLNEIADTSDIIKVSKIVNGGTNGLDSRIAFYKKALEVIK